MKRNVYAILIGALSLFAIIYILLDTSYQQNYTSGGVTYRKSSTLVKNDKVGVYSGFDVSASSKLNYVSSGYKADSYSYNAPSSSSIRYTSSSNVNKINNSYSLLGNAANDNSSKIVARVASGGGSTSNISYGRTVSTQTGSAYSTSSLATYSSATIDQPFSTSSSEAITRLAGVDADLPTSPGSTQTEDGPIGSVLWLLLLVLPYIVIKKNY